MSRSESSIPYKSRKRKKEILRLRKRVQKKSKLRAQRENA